MGSVLLAMRASSRKYLFVPFGVLGLLIILSTCICDCLAKEAKIKKQEKALASDFALETGKAGKSLVPAAQYIGAKQARLMLAKALLGLRGSKKWQEARDILINLSQSGFREQEVSLLLLKTKIKLQQRSSAFKLAKKLQTKWSDKANLLSELADAYAELGLYAQCRDLYRQALNVAGLQEEMSIRLDFAGRMFLWGDYYQARQYLKQYLNRYPASWQPKVQMADTLVPMQLFTRAKKEYLELLQEVDKGHAKNHEKHKQQILYKLYTLEMVRKDFDRANAYLECIASDSNKLIFLKGQALFKSGRYQESIKVLKGIKGKSDEQARALVLIGRSKAELGSAEQAADFYARAKALEPDDPEMIFYALGKKTAGSQEFIKDLLQKDLDIKWLTGWADMYADKGLFEQSITCYEQVLKKAPAYFPARMGLSEVLASKGDYKDSLNILASLHNDFPQSTKISITRARVLGWSRQYQKALEGYFKILERHAQNSRAGLEAARTAYWAKEKEKGDELYEALLTPEADRHSLQYKQQEKIRLEYRAKQLIWDKRFIPARNKLQELVRIEPGNEEARFDLAQTECVLGLCDQEALTYKRLLDIDPLHSLAQKALKRQKIRSRPDVQLTYSLWDEEGRGELAQIRRSHYGLNIDIPVYCRHKLKLGQSRYLEDPKEHSGSVRAEKTEIGFTSRINAFLALDANIGFKDYDQDYEDQKTGRLGVGINFWDYAHLNLSAQRENVIANYYSLSQGIQKDFWQADLFLPLTHKNAFRMRQEYIDYSDDNSGLLTRAAWEHALTEHPRQLKFALSGEYRDTRKESQMDTEPKTHPYWTPQDYWQTAVTLSFRHDLSRYFFCGSKKHFYELKATSGTDTEDNPSIELSGQWSFEFKRHWGIHLKGMLHESKDWDASSVQVGVEYRF